MSELEEYGIHTLIERSRTADILDIVQSCGIDVPANGQICCPFHDDSKPSMRVYPSSNSSYCFTCHRVYDGIDFIRLFNRMSFLEAVEYIVEHFETEDISDDGLAKGSALPPKKYFMSGVPDRYKIKMWDFMTFREYKVREGLMNLYDAVEEIWEMFHTLKKNKEKPS